MSAISSGSIRGSKRGRMPLMFRAVMEQIRASPHTKLLHGGGVIWTEIDDDAEVFYETWLPQHTGIVMRASRLDQELIDEVWCRECTKRYGPCSIPDCIIRQRKAPTAMEVRYYYCAHEKRSRCELDGHWIGDNGCTPSRCPLKAKRED